MSIKLTDTQLVMLPISTPISFAFNGAIIWAGRLPPICRVGFS